MPIREIEMKNKNGMKGRNQETEEETKKTIKGKVKE